MIPFCGLSTSRRSTSESSGFAGTGFGGSYLGSPAVIMAAGDGGDPAGPDVLSPAALPFAGRLAAEDRGGPATDGDCESSSGGGGRNCGSDAGLPEGTGACADCAKAAAEPRRGAAARTSKDRQRGFMQ